MTVLLNYLWRIWLLILVLVLTLSLGLPVYLFSFSPKLYRFSYFFIRLWCIGIFYGMGFRYELIRETQKQIEKKRQYVIISNHTSIMDIMLSCILFPKHPICFVGKKELVKIPIFGTIYKRICVMVDRNSARSRADVYRRCAEKMQKGNSIVIYPEGGVSDDPNLLLGEFKDGAFILASKHQFPIAVFTFVGLKKMFPFNHKKGHPGKVKVFFNDIIEPEANKEVLKNKAFLLIKSTLEKHSIS